MPQVINTGGPPDRPPNLRGYGFKRRGSGFWAKFAAQGAGFKLNVIGSFLGILLVIAFLFWRFLIPKSSAKEEITITPTPYPTVDMSALPPPSQQITTSVFNSPEIPTQSLTNDEIQATAIFQAAIQRPAAVNNPVAAPYFIGVITYEPGCKASNVGFTTSGYNGEPYYLYLRQPLERDPFMQIVQLSGYVQVFDDCQHPVIFVEQLFWMDQTGTPSPLATVTPLTMTGKITGTATITATAAVNTWGRVNTQTVAYVPPSRDIPPLPTYTPYPTYTQQPVEIVLQTVIPHIPVQATYTPYPTWTPNLSTATPTATATPQPITLYGPVVAVGGCTASNFAIQASSSSQNYFIIFDGAQLPQGEPTRYLALATGILDVACGGQAIKAKSITWYEVTPTPIPTPTITLTSTTPTDTPTPTLTPTATITPTEVITS